MGEIFNDHVLATAILDRLLHHATTLNVKGESYRLKEKRRAGVVGPGRGAEERAPVAPSRSAGAANGVVEHFGREEAPA